MSSSKILIVEDEDTLRQALKYNFSQEGYAVITAGDGAQAIDLARAESPDIIILDIMLPKIDGFEVCRILRNEMIVPILMLTAKEEEIDKVLGLELGADDYITKPFSMRELKSRIKAMLRRVEMHQSKPAKMNFRMISSGNLKIDESKRRVILDDSEIEMKPKEFDLLTFLVANHGQVFSREQLLKQIWDYDYIGDSRTVDVHIRWLREKIETTPSQPKRLITVRSIGYKFKG